jgi:hypothetical protein
MEINGFTTYSDIRNQTGSIEDNSRTEFLELLEYEEERMEVRPHHQNGRATQPAVLPEEKIHKG